jgi:indole-3-glycerol phosphate synthase
VATYLDGILTWHRARAARDTRHLGGLIEAAASLGGVRNFSAQLRREGGSERVPGGYGRPAVIAEVKRRSPSKGDLARGLDPSALALEYERGGAACLSVLTDQQFFAGSPGDLVAARGATRLPVLRKDFTVCEADVCDARLMGADCVLLIAAGLDDDLLGRLMNLAEALGMGALVEVHDEAEASRALDAGAILIGVNQRDLSTFEVDPSRAEQVAEHLPASVVKVAESGISSREDIERLARAGFDAVLVGEALVRSADREAAVRRLAGAAAANPRRPLRHAGEAPGRQFAPGRQSAPRRQPAPGQQPSRSPGHSEPAADA